MSNIRKLLGRLNCANVKFDVGRGGIPERTPQDIAAALGMATEKLGVELLCWRWWPDGARVSKRELERQLLHAVVGEYGRRQQDRLHASLRHFSGNGPPPVPMEWPRLSARYRNVAEAVLAEIGAVTLCPICAGRGQVRNSGLLVKCPECNDRCTAIPSDRARATACRLHHKTYADSWRIPYEWLMSRCGDLETNAARQVAAALELEAALGGGCIPAA